MRSRTIGLLAVLALGCPAPALAEETETFEGLVAGAMEHYQAQRYAEAIELFQRAHDLRAEPELVYNIARSYERLARLEEAIAAYEQFLSLPATTAELRARARANLTALRQEQAELEASQEPHPLPPPTPPPADDRAAPLSIAGWALFGIGAATALVGVVFAGLTISGESDFQQAEVDDDRLSMREDVERDALVADVLLFTGGAVCLTGIVLLVVNAVRAHRREPRPDAGLALHPLVLEHGLGLGAWGRF
jgi:tetratricopeptide (TPR) repeat protein